MHGELLPSPEAKQDFKLPFVLKGPWLNPSLAPDLAAPKAAPTQ
jgi:hypothetical protein